MKSQLILLVLFLSSITSSACSCSSLKITNAFSLSDYVGVVEFHSVSKIKDDTGFYESEYSLHHLYKGTNTPKIYINSMEGSSCGFIPKLNKKYFILAEKINGRFEISFCSVMEVPDKDKLELLDQLQSYQIPALISRNIYQVVTNEINSDLFPKANKGIFIYKVNLNNKLDIITISPVNKNANDHFSDSIKVELQKKIIYRTLRENVEFQDKKLISFIILSWKKNYEGKILFGPTKL